MKCQLWTLNGRQFSLSTRSTKLKLSQYYRGLFQWRSQRNNSCMLLDHGKIISSSVDHPFCYWPLFWSGLLYCLLHITFLWIEQIIYSKATNTVNHEKKKKLKLWYYKVCLIFELFAWGNIDNNFNTKKPQYKSFIHWGPVENWY